MQQSSKQTQAPSIPPLPPLPNTHPATNARQLANRALLCQRPTGKTRVSPRGNGGTTSPSPTAGIRLKASRTCHRRACTAQHNTAQHGTVGAIRFVRLFSTYVLYRTYESSRVESSRECGGTNSLPGLCFDLLCFALRCPFSHVSYVPGSGKLFRPKLRCTTRNEKQNKARYETFAMSEL